MYLIQIVGHSVAFATNGEKQVMLRNRVAILIVVLTIAGCATAPVDDFATSASGYVEDQAAYITQANWGNAGTVEVVLDEFAFAPDSLRFTAGQPYRLRLTNAGDVTHFFVSEGFFRSIAVRSLSDARDSGGPILLESIAMPAGSTRELTFIPVVAGSYALECTVPFHAMFGMEGEITIIGG